MSSATTTRPGRGKSHLVEALGHLAIDKGKTVAWHTLETLAQLLRRHRADDSINKAISKLIRADLVVIDLCRHRDYADIVATVELSAPRCLGFSPVRRPVCRHSHRLSRNARVASAGL